MGRRSAWLWGTARGRPGAASQAEAQGTGIGTELLERLAADLAGEGVDKTILLTAGGTRAESFYAANGFRRSSRMVLMIADRG